MDQLDVVPVTVPSFDLLAQDDLDVFRLPVA